LWKTHRLETRRNENIPFQLQVEVSHTGVSRSSGSERSCSNVRLRLRGSPRKEMQPLPDVELLPCPASAQPPQQFDPIGDPAQELASQVHGLELRVYGSVLSSRAHGSPQRAPPVNGPHQWALFKAGRKGMDSAGASGRRRRDPQGGCRWQVGGVDKALMLVLSSISLIHTLRHRIQGEALRIPARWKAHVWNRAHEGAVQRAVHRQPVLQQRHLSKEYKVTSPHLPHCSPR
jgi:hypothetical protein